MVGVRLVRDDPGDGWERAGLSVGEEPRRVLDIAELPVLLDVGERRQRVPDVRSADAEGRAGTVGVAALAVWLAAGSDSVPPADPVLV